MTPESIRRRKHSRQERGRLKLEERPILAVSKPKELSMAETRIDPLAIVQYVTTGLLLVLLFALFWVMSLS
jgi:hypothetical protein